MRNCEEVGKNYTSGDWNIRSGRLDSLYGCPEYITGHFICSDNELRTLVGGPQKVDGGYFSSENRLTDLLGSPKHITTGFHVDTNQLTSLVGGPQRVDGIYNCYDNQLSDLVGCASHIGDTLNCFSNNITSLVGIHKIIKSCGSIRCSETKITEGGIGLLLIDNLVRITSKHEPFQIISKYLGKGTKGMMDCRAELISKGYSEYAKL